MAGINAGNAKKASLDDFVPIPDGMSLTKAKDFLIVAVGETHALRCRRVYGYVGEIAYLQEDPDIPATCKTPARIQAVIMLWRRYGCLVEGRCDSWRYARVVAFASTAAFEEESAISTAGDPITGVIEATSGSYLAAQLSGWKPVTASEWKLCPPRAFSENGFELNGDAVASLPALAKEHLGHTHAPNVPFARTYGFFEPKCLVPYVKEPLIAAARTRTRSDGPRRGRSSSPKNSPGRRLRERYYPKIASGKAELLASAAQASRHPERMKAPPARLPP